MKKAVALLIANIVSMACIAAAFGLAYEGKGGWGWFLFVACLFAHSLSSTKDKNTGGN